jgi:hypothetical protein
MKYIAFLMVFVALVMGCGSNETTNDGGQGGQSSGTASQEGGGGQSTTTTESTSTSTDAPQCEIKAELVCPKNPAGVIFVSTGYIVAQRVPFDQEMALTGLGFGIVHGKVAMDSMGNTFSTDTIRPKQAWLALGDSGDDVPPPQEDWLGFQVSAVPTDPNEETHFEVKQVIDSPVPIVVDPALDAIWLMWESPPTGTKLLGLTGCADPESVDWNSVILPPGSDTWVNFGPGLGVEVSSYGLADCAAPPPKTAEVWFAQ